jgi:hypothetical protein
MNEPLCEVELDHSPIPSGTLQRIVKLSIKRAGHVWKIHRNDADPHPSNPHTHNVESGLKLDLTDGTLHFGRRFAGTKVSAKDLRQIRRQAQLKGVTLPPLAPGLSS